ncbi:DNA polymerase III subunit epsilon family exonuclease [Candidatus Moduliflexus flocculans]|uniref:DNA 3'-5' helicase n=1 Tax=Candidatus Moduliflexus flocculans TaxID=1499966 RepID=A0A0S6VTH6_9BACT|nr:DNA polymerase III subunit epsilon family exonuclease [Candidatus Moduliflexus flocculans]
MNEQHALNDKQRQAVTAPLMPILVLAGPGTGKTRTLIARILYQINHFRIAPHKIIAVTFTNKAKEEMRARLRRELGDMANDVMIGTFHRYCVETLRRYHHEAGLAKQFTIADETAQFIALSRASRMTDDKSLRNVLTAISSYRLNKENLNPAFQGMAERWLPHYHEELHKNNLIDFDQIILLTQALFAAHPEIVETERQRFDAILIDEFQDTDPVQYAIICALARQHRNIFAVADDDQSIFAWRGAHIANIERFLDDFQCRDRLVVLNENYRSNQRIIDTAAQLLYGHRLLEKQLHAMTAENAVFDQQIEFRRFENDDDETRFVLTQIEAATAAPCSLRYADIAILYPNHAIGERLEAALLAAKIPCQLVKRQGIFDQPDVRKLLLLLTLVQNPDDDVALEQYVELELDNDGVMQELRRMKRKDRSFKQTLHAAMWRDDLPGISKGQFSRFAQTCLGTISNLISYVEQNPEIPLEECFNHICNLSQPAHSASLHSKAREISDPLAIEGIIAAAARIRETLRGGFTVHVAGNDAELARLCLVMLRTAPNVAPQPDAAFRLLSTTQDIHEQDVILCLDSAMIPRLPRSSAVKIVLCDPSEQLDDADNYLAIQSALTPAVACFKLLQALTTAHAPKPFRHYVAFDLETTSGDTRTAGIVEIGAVKVRDGVIVGRFGRLVNPEIPITDGAFRVHGISDAEVAHEPTFAQLLPELMEFIGDDMLVAHNGFSFDFPILFRLYREATGAMLANRRFDTLPLARRLFPGQPASVDALMQRFGIQDIGGRHRALDDAVYLTPIFERLQDEEHALNRRTEHEELLEIAALGSMMAARRIDAALADEERLLFRLGARKLLSRFSELPAELSQLFEQYRIDLEARFEAMNDADAEQHEGAATVFSGKEVSLARIKELARAFPPAAPRASTRCARLVLGCTISMIRATVSRGRTTCRFSQLTRRPEPPRAPGRASSRPMFPQGQFWGREARPRILASSAARISRGWLRFCPLSRSARSTTNCKSPRKLGTLAI